MHIHASVCRKLTLQPVIIYIAIALFLAGCAGGGGVSSGTSDGSATNPPTAAGATRAVPEFSPHVVVDQSGNRELRLAWGVDDIRYHGQSLRSSRTPAENAAQQQLTEQIQQQLQQWTQGKSVTRSSSVVPFYRIPVAWSLDPTVPPNVLLQTPMGSPMATYVEDAASGFIRSFGVPTADGTYIWNWTWTNDKGTNTNVNYVYVVSAGNATLTQSINGSPPSQVYSGPPVNNATLNLSISQAAGVIGTFDDNTLENVFIGTWTVTETFTPGTQSVLGTFDMRMLAVQNVSTSPPLFDPKLPSTDPNSHTTITADIFALPASTSLAPNGWVPAGAGVPWRMPIINPAGPAPVKTFVGIAPITPSSGGKVGSISQIWSGDQDSSSSSAPAGVYQPLVQALGALDVGNALTRRILTQVSLEVPSVEITNVTITPTIDPGQTPAAELKADVVSTGFLDNFTIEWAVSVADAAGNIVHQATGTGTTADVPIDVQWDAKDPTGTVVPDGDYTFTVTAEACDLGGQPTRSLPRGVAFVRQPSGGSCIAAMPVIKRATRFPKNITIKLSRQTVLPRWRMHPEITPGARLETVKDASILDYNPYNPNPYPDANYSWYCGVRIHLTGFPHNKTAKIRLKPSGVRFSGFHNHDNYPRPAGDFFTNILGSSVSLLPPDADSNPPAYTISIPVGSDGTGDYPDSTSGFLYLPSEFAGQEQITGVDASGAAVQCNNPTLTVRDTTLIMNNVASDINAGNGNFVVNDGKYNVTVTCEQTKGSTTEPFHSDSNGVYQGYWMDVSAEKDLAVGFSQLASHVRNSTYGLLVDSIILNDMTLRYGGKFDFAGKWNLSAPDYSTPYLNPFDIPGTASTDHPQGNQAHRFHRLGKSVDILDIHTNGVFRRHVGEKDRDTYLKSTNWFRVLETGSIHYDYVVSSSQTTAFSSVFPDTTADTNATTGGANP